MEVRGKVLKLQEEMHKAEVGSPSWLAEVPRRPLYVEDVNADTAAVLHQGPVVHGSTD